MTSPSKFRPKPAEVAEIVFRNLNEYITTFCKFAEIPLKFIQEIHFAIILLIIWSPLLKLCGSTAIVNKVLSLPRKPTAS